MEELLKKLHKAGHDAAVRRLKDKITYDEAEELVLAIGYTGNEADFPLLEGVFDNAKRWGMWRVAIEDASTAALARLGNEKALERIKAVLAEPVPARIPLERVGDLQAAIRKAGFSQNPTFIPLLIKHLGDVAVETPPTDVAQSRLDGEVRTAIYEIVNHQSSCLDHRDIDFEKVEAWWESNKSKFSQ